MQSAQRQWASLTAPPPVEEGDLVSVPLQGGFQQGAEIPVVVHHQNMGMDTTSVQQKIEPPRQGVEDVNMGGIEGVDSRLWPPPRCPL